VNGDGPSPKEKEGSQPNTAAADGSDRRPSDAASTTAQSEADGPERAAGTASDTTESSAADEALSGTEGSPPAARWLNRTRLARLVALVGVLVVVLAAKSLVFPHIPATREIDLHIESPHDVIGLDMRWAPAGTTEDIATTSLHFLPGAAPTSVITTVHLPDGEYDVSIAVVRAAGVDSTRRRITLDGASRVTIPLR
jgi:hypothetical protein